MTETIPGWDDTQAVDPEDVPVPGSRPRVQHASQEQPERPQTDWDRLARTYTVGGQDTQLFPVGALLEATGFTYSGLRKWERDGSFPKARFRSPRSGALPGHRLYTRAFIEGVARIMSEEGIKPTHRNIARTEFFPRVQRLFRSTGG